jgi:DAHP synthetase I family
VLRLLPLQRLPSRAADAMTAQSRLRVSARAFAMNLRSAALRRAQLSFRAMWASESRCVAAAGASMWRGGADRTRTSPHSFEGVGRDGRRVLAEARGDGSSVTELTDVREIGPVLEVADAIQIGARAMPGVRTTEQ